MHDISTGASNDIERATTIVRKMVTRYGMSDKLGPITFGGKQDEIFLGKDFGTHRNYSEKIAASIDKEIKTIIDAAYKKAETLLRENIDKLHKVANTLLEKEKLDVQEFEEVFASA